MYQAFAFILALCCWSNLCHAQDSRLNELAEKAGVKLIVTSSVDTPPNVPIGIAILPDWKPTDESFKTCHALLKAMPNRKVVNIHGPIKKSALSRLTRIAEDLGELRINRVPIVSLGILVNPKSLEIAKVVIESSELEIGDKILRMNKTPIKNFASMRTVLCEFVPGTDVELVIQRGKTDQTLTVKLSGYPSPNNDH